MRQIIIINILPIRSCVLEKKYIKRIGYQVKVTSNHPRNLSEGKRGNGECVRCCRGPSDTPDHVIHQLPYRREAPIGGTPLYKKQLGLFLQIFNILRKKGEINFKIGGIG
jgi:hypothetical protein